MIDGLRTEEQERVEKRAEEHLPRQRVELLEYPASVMATKEEIEAELQRKANLWGDGE